MKSTISASKLILVFIAAGWALPSLGYAAFQISADMTTSINQYATSTTTTTDIVSLDTSFLTQVWTTSFSGTWPSSSTGNYATGKILPPEVVAAAYPTGSFATLRQQLSNQLSGGANPLLTTQAEMDSYGGICTVLTDAFEENAGDVIPKILASKQNTLPPVKGDIVIYNLMVVLDRDQNSFNPLTDDQLTSWTNFAKAQNPVYRLIAAQSFAKIAGSYTQWATFYALFANETDPDIAKIVVTTLGNSNQKSLITTLQTIQTGQTSVGNATVAQLAATTIQNLQNTGT